MLNNKSDFRIHYPSALLLRLLMVLVIVQLSTTAMAQVTGLSADPLAGYEPMGTPRKDIPVGATWIKGTGPTGNGLPAEKLRVAASYGEGDIQRNSEFEAGLKASLSKFLKLDAAVGADFEKSVELHFEQMEVVTVANLSDLSPNPNQSYLYEGLRLKKMSLVYDKDNRASLEAELQQRFGEVSTEVVSDRQVRSTLTGADLYLAYRVFTFGKPRMVAEQTKKLVWKKGQVSVQFKDGVELQCLPFEALECFGVQSEAQAQAALDRCANDHPMLVIVTQTEQVDFTGMPLRDTTLLAGTSFQNRLIEVNSYLDQDGLISKYVVLDGAYYSFSPMGKSGRQYVLILSTFDAKATYRHLQVPFKVESGGRPAGW